jgi:hypothetical protein
MVYYYLPIKISFPVALSFFHRGYKDNVALLSFWNVNKIIFINLCMEWFQVNIS